VLIVTDRNVAVLHIEPLLDAVRRAGMDADAFIIPSGERFKTFATWKRIIERLSEMDDKRDLVVCALGGGVVGDLAGFAAASYRRGISYVQIPTTLLACVDSSVGGKTGFDLPRGKNLVGAFYQPECVIADPALLTTLPMRELRCGMAEVIKYGFVMDAPFIGRLEKNMGGLLDLEPAAVSSAIERCCRLKARVVAQDERDTSGVRAILNFGHTFGHAMEAACGYGRYKHGEAVAVGMVLAAELSVKLGMISKRDSERLERLVETAGLPTRIRGAEPEELLPFMRRDKKTRAGKLRLVLLESAGRAVVADAPPEKTILQIIKNGME